MRTDLLTGSALVTSVWGAIGVVVVFGAIILIIFKFFLGASKNVGAGIAALVGISVMAALAANPDSMIGLGNTIKGILGL